MGHLSLSSKLSILHYTTDCSKCSDYTSMLLLACNTKQGLVVQSTVTVKILKIGTIEIITIIVLQLEQLDFTAVL